MTATAEQAVTTTDTDREAESRRKLTLLKAVGLDKVSPEQRELALAIAKRYDLDLLLKHLVLIDGKPFVTRDALLWIAHRDGHLDGIEVTEPVIRDYQGVDYWYATATVYRSDMTHPFVYGGRYPVKGQNAKFGPEMATKVAESMSLRRAFNISAPTQDERWDVDIPTAEPEPPKSLAAKVAERAAHVYEGQPEPLEADLPPTPAADPDTGEVIEAPVTAADAPEAADAPNEPIEAETPAAARKKASEGAHQCESVSPISDGQCRLVAGHGGAHRPSTTETF